VNDVPWYAEGLRFTCKKNCNKCCFMRKGECVRATSSDVAKLQCVTKKSVFQICEYTNAIGVVLRTGPCERGLRKCAFLDPSKPLGCTVYKSRPVQCSTYPWWPEILKSPQTWKAEKKNCPCIGVGDLHSLDEIQSNLSKIIDSGG